jgi:hypothetical protein
MEKSKNTKDSNTLDELIDMKKVLESKDVILPFINK